MREKGTLEVDGFEFVVDIKDELTEEGGSADGSKTKSSPKVYTID